MMESETKMIIYNLFCSGSIEGYYSIEKFIASFDKEELAEEAKDQLNRVEKIKIWRNRMRHEKWSQLNKILDSCEEYLDLKKKWQEIFDRKPIYDQSMQKNKEYNIIHREKKWKWDAELNDVQKLIDDMNREINERSLYYSKNIEVNEEEISEIKLIDEYFIKTTVLNPTINSLINNVGE